jgi:hypothetical protein
VSVVLELKAIPALGKLTVPWPAPQDRYTPTDLEHAELTRILGAISVEAQYTTKAEVLAALDIAKSTEAVLGVLFRPWPSVGLPTSPDASAEFYRTYRQWRVIRSALAEHPYKPRLVCLIDTESFNGRDPALTAAVAGLYQEYDEYLRLITKCQDVLWYGFAPTPAPADPDEWGFHPFSAPFVGLQGLGFELYHLGEIGLKREASRRAKVYANSLGVPKTVGWVSAPGCGWEFQWDKDANGRLVYQTWQWDAGSKVRYDVELGRELYGKWNGERPGRFMAQPEIVCTYPHPFDPRIVDPERKHLLGFLRGATE